MYIAPRISIGDGRYIHISGALDRIFISISISISISHAATVLLLVLVVLLVVLVVVLLLTTYHYHLANISTWFRVPVSESVLKK